MLITLNEAERLGVMQELRISVNPINQRYLRTKKLKNNYYKLQITIKKQINQQPPSLNPPEGDLGGFKAKKQIIYYENKKTIFSKEKLFVL